MAPSDKHQIQKNAADTGKSVHLSASAGSGKTRALKDRYLALLDVLDKRGLAIDQAVAITFTEKAAAEIKERVIGGLPEAVLKKIIRGRQDLRISTIHSFCMNVLKRYPLEAGLPPDFGVLDSRDQAAKIRKAVEDTLEGSDQDREIMAPLKGFTVDELISTIEYLLSIRSRLKRMEIDAQGPDGLLKAIRTGMEIDAAEAELTTLITGDEWRTSFQEMERILKAEFDNYVDCMGPGHLLLAAAKDADTASRISSELSPIYFTLEGAPRKNAKIAAKAFKGGNRKEYEKLFFAIQALLYRLRNAYQRAQAGRESLSMLRLYLRSAEQYQASKIREGLLDFDDLEIYTYRLLQNSESPEILYWLDRKILHFLVDEFQDTSDIQWAILDKLTSEIFAGLGADKRMPPTLFVVGDEKQSIYRFREANYRLIENVKQKMETLLPPGSRAILTLDKNFRSTPEVIETVNRVFAGLWGERYKASDVDRKDHKGSVQLIEIQQTPADAQLTGPTEAEVLAREISSLIERGATVYERSAGTKPPQSLFSKGGKEEIPPLTKGGGGGFETGPVSDWKMRPAAFGDCAILIQSRTRLKEYETALQQAGIPFRVIGGIGFYEEDEIQALMSTLFFLWNKDDKLALAAALTSALFGFTDKDIFDLMQHQGDMADALRTLKPGAWELLHRWQQLAGVAPLASLIHMIVNESGAYVRFGRRNPQAVFNIDKLLDTAREFDRRGYTTLQDFVEWVRNIRRTEQREAAADMNLPGFQGSVGILTVHKAKGLEFPIVFLPGMNQAARSLTIGPEALISETGGMPRIAIKDPDNPVYDDMWKGDSGEQEELRREHQRLLYVAMTRARDHLIMLGTLGAGKTPIKQNTWLDYLYITAPQPLFEAPITDPAGTRCYSYPSSAGEPSMTEKPPSARFFKRNADQAVTTQIEVQQVLDNISPLPRSEALEWKRATDFIERKMEDATGAPALSGETRDVSPLTRGSVLHRCLEEHSKAGVYDIDRITAEYPEIMTLGHDAQNNFKLNVGSILGSILENRDRAWIFERRDKSYSELPFLYKKGHSLVSGIIDRVVIRDGKGSVIDYKSILIENDGALRSWKDHYRPQIKIYCEAVKEIFKLERVEGYLLFLDSNRLELVV
ncbi:MAG: UvrD-helicase domain-containing protein [Nitrospirae bacterium]|nr:UvrD-helicase domain-containing protein [Nitrospirota bacterium]